VPVKKFKDGKKKADVDSRMTFEIMLLLKKYDSAIFMTGDGDFYWVFEYLLKTKKNTKLIAHSRSTAQELKQLFKGDFTDINKIKHLVARKNEADALKGSASRDYGNNVADQTRKVKNKKRGRP